MPKNSRKKLLDRMRWCWNTLKTYFAAVFALYIICVVLGPGLISFGGPDKGARWYFAGMGLAVSMLYCVLQEIKNSVDRSGAEFRLNKDRINYYDDLRMKMESQDRCHLVVYANSFRRIWNGLFHPLFSSAAVDATAKLKRVTIDVIKRQEEAGDDSTIGDVVNDLAAIAKKSGRTPDDLVSSFHIYSLCKDPCFTGFAINDKYLRLRFRNKGMTDSDVIKECYKDDGPASTAMIKWYLSVCTEAISRGIDTDVILQVKGRMEHSP